MTCDSKFGKSGLVIELAMIGNPRGEQMRFPAFRRERQSFLHRSPGLRDAGRGVITSQPVKLLVGPSKLTVREIELGIVCHGLIQQTYCLAALLDDTRVERLPSQRFLAAQITVVGEEIRRGRLLNRSFLCW